MAKDKADPKETAVREAAAGLNKAILDARAAGYAVTWPSRVEDLESIQISETGAMRDGDQVAGLTPVIAQGVVVGDKPLDPQA